MSHAILINGFDKWDFPHYVSTMTTKLTLDRAGRVPGRIRTKAKPKPGKTATEKDGSSRERHHPLTFR
jgi:hypothetical protein